ncbi:TPA: Glu/Leu/Phe/Val dehydrogenase dimerization domain-containing protein [Bacillus cereus]
MSVYKITLRDPEIDLIGFIVIDSLVNGMSAGGLRMTSNVSLEEVEELAKVMTKKYMVSGVEMGGAKSGIIYNPDKHDKNELIRRFAELAKPFLVENYLLGEDLGVTVADIESVYRAIKINPVALVKARLESKGIKVNVSPDIKLNTLFNKENAVKVVGSTIIISTQKAVGYLRKSLDEMTIAVQGFGTIGQVSAESIYRLGGKIIAVEDVEGCIYCLDGLDIPNLISKTSISGIIDRTRIDPRYELKPNGSWVEGAEILIPAAIKHSINETNVHKINASIIIEAANVPVSKDAERYLIEKGTIIIPDFICNSGAAAFFGMLISGQEDLETIFEKVQSNVENSLVEILEDAKGFERNVRKAANYYIQKNHLTTK